MARHLIALAVLLGAANALPVTLKSRWMSKVGRQDWLVNHTIVEWEPSQTGIVVVDMWDVHWCHTATTRVGEIATPMNHTLAAARELGINIIFAPSDVTSFYSSSAARKRTLSLKNVTLPPSTPKFPSDKTPPFPLSSATDGGCDAHAPEGSPWKRQIATLTIDEQVDYLIAADLPSNAHAGTQELWNIMGAKGIKHLIYMGVHENMCIMGRPFAIEQVASWGMTQDNIAVMRELVDVMYTPIDPPYVSHAEGLALHTAYIEKFWASSVSMYDFLVPEYKPVGAAGGGGREL